MQVNRPDVNNLLMQMRDMKAQASGMSGVQPRSDVEAVVGGAKKVDAPNFSDMFSSAINKVNDTQKHSASQKSSVAFQATTQVRNKLVEAYKDVMNMPL